jgi:plastocyanin
MNGKTSYSFACAAFAAVVCAGSLAGCFSERVAGTDEPSAEELCNGSQPNVVRIREYAFGPGTLTVEPGTRVYFANCDSDSHTSTSDTGVWDSPLLAPNTVYSRVFDAAGSFPYHCDPHPFMTGTVVVQ